MFVELVTPCGISVQYVKGSGKNFYIQNLNWCQDTIYSLYYWIISRFNFFPRNSYLSLR
jgi:hypothetical protein